MNEEVWNGDDLFEVRGEIFWFVVNDVSVLVVGEEVIRGVREGKLLKLGVRSDE
jgi:hypothetical protein